MPKTPKISRIILCLITASSLAGSLCASILPSSLSNKQREASIANLLGWHATDANYCGGAYDQPLRLATEKTPKSLNQRTHITSRGPNLLLLKGISVLRNNVVVKQPGVEAHADKASITRNTAGDITLIHLTGHVHLYENKRHLVSDSLEMHFKTDKIRAETVIYRIFSKKALRREALNAWGTASSFKQIRRGLTEYKHATYSTCQPINPPWSVRAKKLVMDTDSGLGTVHNAMLTIKGVPVFPLPYWQFPIDKRRRSGMLAPSYKHETINGTEKITNNIFSLPIYLNIAPNADDILTFNVESQRGLILGNHARYLNAYAQSDLQFLWAPNDRLAQKERQWGIDTITGNTNYPTEAANTYLDGLNKMGSNRYEVNWATQAVFNPDWTADVKLHRVSDNYVLRDYALLNTTEYNLLRSVFDLNGNTGHWRTHMMVESYQPLHRYDQMEYTVATPYERQPEIAASGYYANWLGSSMDLSLSGEFDRFVYHDIFTSNMPEGNREHVRPALSRPIAIPGGSVTPAIAWDLRSYQLTKDSPANYDSTSYATPIASVDSELTWANPLTLFKRSMHNELNAHLLYLFVPTTNQDATPNFDSYLLPFSYAQLFSLNRYTGYDKLSNANQLSLGLSDRIIDPETGAELAHFNAGIADSFVTPAVCLTPGCVMPIQSLSPLVTDAALTIAPNWQLGTSAAWNLSEKKMNNVTGRIQYKGEGQRAFQLSYSFAPKDVNTLDNIYWLDNGVSNNLNVSGTWPLFERWRVLGYADYDFHYKRSNLSFVGVEYDACCWRFRLIYQRLSGGAVLVGNQSLSKQFKQLRHSVLLTLELKGLHDFGDASASKGLTQKITGYDTFN